MKKHKTTRRSIAFGLLLLAIAGGTYGFTASNTFTTNGGAAGQGAGSISGYTVGTPSYTLLTSDSTKITSFTFTMSPVTAGTAVKAGLVSGTYADSCAIGTITSSSATVSCSYTSGSEPLVSAATSLTVVGVN